MYPEYPKYPESAPPSAPPSASVTFGYEPLASSTLAIVPECVSRRPLSPRVTAALASLLACKQRARDIRRSAVTVFGDRGAWIAGGFCDHWPESTKDLLRVAETEATKYLDEARAAWKADRRTRATFRAVLDGLDVGCLWYVSLRPEHAERFDLRASLAREANTAAIGAQMIGGA